MSVNGYFETGTNNSIRVLKNLTRDIYYVHVSDLTDRFLLSVTIEFHCFVGNLILNEVNACWVYYGEILKKALRKH